MHDPAVAAVPGPAAVRAADVVPHDQVVPPPFVTVDEARLRRPLEQLRQRCCRTSMPCSNRSTAGAPDDSPLRMDVGERVTGWRVELQAPAVKVVHLNDAVAPLCTDHFTWRVPRPAAI